MAQGKIFPTFKELFSIIITFALAVFAWIFFRAENLEHALHYIVRIFTNPDFITSLVVRGDLLVLIFFFTIVEWFGREQQFALAKIGLSWKRPMRYALYFTLIITLFWFGGKEQQFIYFEF